MDKIIVKGGRRLEGTVHIDGAKNAALPILAASILGQDRPSELHNMPLLSDIYLMEKVLNHLTIETQLDQEERVMHIDATGELMSETPYEFMSKMRASIVVMGPLLARTGYAKVAMPGGCAIGTRPIDLHLKGFEAMGVKIKREAGHLEAFADHLHGAEIYLDFPSVGATQNIMMAATMAVGETEIQNAAREPEIVDLANYLNKMGAHIVGAGTETIRIEGVDKLVGTEHTIISDRIEAGTFMVAAAITQGNVLVKDALAEHNKPLMAKLQEMGVKIIEEDEGIRVIGPEELTPTDVKTLPYPGFPTDLQAPMTIAQIKAKGTSIMRETVFENRFMHLEEMRKMNAEFTIDGQTAIISGYRTLEGAEVASSDLRASSALILAGLIAKGYTQVTNLEHLDRGYHLFHEKLYHLGADIERVDKNGETVPMSTQTQIVTEK